MELMSMSQRWKYFAVFTVATAALGAGRLLAATPVSSAPPIAAITTEGQRGDGVPAFKIKPGFKVTVAIAIPPEARFMQFDSFGTLYLSAPRHGTITTYKLRPDGTYQKIADVVKGKSTVHGMEFVDGWLWFTTSTAVYKGKVRPGGSGLDEVTTLIPDGSVPSGGGHWWRPILVDQDGFYTGIGDARNFSDLDDPKNVAQEGPHSEEREKIWKYSLDGKTKTLFVSGIRNTEKLMYRPGTHEVWGLDHGSDWWGLLLGDDQKGHQPITDDIPGEEVNHYELGKFYGHPFIADNNLVRPEYDTGGPLAKANIKELLATAVPPAYMFPAHWANNGWTWLNKDSALGHRGDMYVGCHGSWNSSLKVGYCVSRLEFSPEGKPMHAEQIVNCLNADRVHFTGRPVDVVEEPGTDNLLFSVDEDGQRPSRSHVYRITAVPTP
jgi:glucose/arabinose dehydrogenase